LGGGEPTDAELVQRARAGDTRAFGGLFDRHAGRVWHVLRAVSRFSKEETEDLLQETFIRAHQHLASLEKPELFGAWVSMIARREAMASAIGSKRRQASEEALAREVELHSGWTGEPKQSAAVAVVRELVLALPEGPERQTVERFYIDGNCTVTELAAELSVAKGTITARLTRFRARVKRRLAALLVAAGDETTPHGYTKGGG
jgi:RNA polymerase sigma-70 factor (ECF subfamily)